MQPQKTEQGTITNYELNDHLETWIEAFLMDRRAQGMAPGTLYFYRKKLTGLAHFCDTRAITRIGQLTPDDLRKFIMQLQETDHTPGGMHAFYRAAKTFLRWYEKEAEPDDWDNPIRKVKPPKVGQQPLAPVELEEVKSLLQTCANDFLGKRDRAIFLCLLDTGCRAAELLALNRDDADAITGAIVIRKGKGSKSRTVFIGRTARKALRQYLKGRQDSGPAMWTTQDGERLTYWGLRSMVARRAKMAAIPTPQLHSFRRAFALNCLRAGMDIYSLQSLMGHADLQVLRRYLAQTTDDLQDAHARFAPGDRLR